MDIYESIDKAQKQASKNEATKFIEASKEYALQGFDEKQVAELLLIDGCDLEISKELAMSACHQLPSKYADNETPLVYNDVKDVVENTFINGDQEMLQQYFGKHASRELSKLGIRILIARDNPSRIYFDELHKEIRPMVEGLLIDNQMEANQPRQASAQLNEKERLELDLFGVWPVYLIQKQARKKKAEEGIYDNHVGF